MRNRFVATSFFALALAACIISGCAREEESTDQKAADFYEDALQVKAQTACNADGWLYDPIERRCLIGAVRLATWECSRDGVGSYVRSVGSADAAMSRPGGFVDLDQLLTEGFRLHQCGLASAQTVHLVLIKKANDGERATLSIRQLYVVAGAPSEPREAPPTPSPEPPSSQAEPAKSPYD